MKKITALLLAAIMLLSLLAACGEKTPAPATENDGGQTAQTGEETTAPAPDDDEEKDKDATETVSNTGEVVITNTEPSGGGTQTTAPQTGSQTSQTPGTQTQTPQTGSQQTQTPQTQTQTQASKDPTVSSFASKTGLYLKKPYSTPRDVRVMIWGDSAINVHSIEDTVRQMALCDGFNITFFSQISNIYGKSSAYQLYELFDWDGTEATSQITGWKRMRIPGHLSNSNDGLDFLVINTGRDRVLTNPVTTARTLTCIKYIYSYMKEKCPQCKLVLYEPPAYEGYGMLSKRIELPVKTLEEHNAMIKDFAKKMSDAVGGDHLTIRAGDALDFFRKNYADTGIKVYDSTGDYPSDAGSYLIASVFYSTLFNKSTVGMEACGLLDAAGAEIMQKAANKFVFGTEGTKTSHAGKPFTEFHYEDFDPRLNARDPRFAKEKYPQYYDEFMAIVYNFCLRGWDVQYDKTSLSQNFYGQSGQNCWRRQYQRGPETVTSQHVLYTDCSGFCDMVYNVGFDYDIPGVDTSGMAYVTAGRMFFWDGSGGDIAPELAAEKFLEVIEPGDVIIQRGSSAGHAMLYIGNGWIAHCTNTHEGGDANDYNYLVKNDSPEPFGGMTFDKIDVLTDPAGAYYTFTSSYVAVNVFRPLSLGIKPNETATLRAKNLKGVITYKECSAFQYGTASKGSDVTFTYVFRNDTKDAKTVSLEDKLPAGLAFKSGDVSFEGGALSKSVSVPARSTVKLSYTATVTAENGTRIDCADTKIGGIPANETPFRVRSTLENGGKAITDAYKSVSASNDLDYINAVYKKALGRETTIGAKADFIKKTFETKDEKVCAKVSSDLMINEFAFGGISCNDMKSIESHRMRNLEMRDLVAGDVIAVLKDPTTLELWLYVGENKLAVFENGALRIVPSANAIALLQSIFGEYAFAVLRPSVAF
ncbi:MAG: C40 family peptidase [Clostridia bacterium]|nr:C40 family peptidase [Clostridia bacterium]